jgi:hypothetical protein
MILSAHQLHYLPWLRYFHKIALSDVFVVMDNIQFNKNGWQNRNKIKHANGWMYLTVPVLHKFQQRIDEVKIDVSQKWRQKHWGALTLNYGKARFFNEYKPFFEGIYQQKWENLNAINYEMLEFYLRSLNIQTRIVKSSDLNVEGTDSTRLVSICKKLGADTYLSGAYAAGVYLDEQVFNDAGISVSLQEWHCPEYPQQYPKAGFVPDLSIVDLLFNCGPASRDILLQKVAHNPC